MNSRQRLERVLNFQEPDQIPLDLGATPVTGMHVSSVYNLRQALGLDPSGEPVRVTNIYQMLGEIRPDLADALGIDVIPLERPVQSFGIRNQGWKEWVTFDGTPVLVPEGFNTRLEPNGDLLIYPQGDCSAEPSGRMPAGGYYVDAINRQQPLIEEQMDPADNLEEFALIPDEDLSFYSQQVDELYNTTDKAIAANPGGTGFGDIAQVPGVQLRSPSGIRDIQEWYMSVIIRKEYIMSVFQGQMEIALQNLERFYAAVGDKISVVFMSGTDFGGQNSLMFSPDLYREVFFPYQKQLNDWVHEHTSWKTFMHNDGAIKRMIPDYIEAGFDILNPVQWTAADMDPEEIKRSFGNEIVIWGAGIDTQKTLPFGTPEEVRQEVEDICRIFGRNGGYVFSSVHNIQAGVPVENLLAYFDAFNKIRMRGK